MLLLLLHLLRPRSIGNLLLAGIFRLMLPRAAAPKSKSFFEWRGRHFHTVIVLRRYDWRQTFVNSPAATVIMVRSFCPVGGGGEQRKN